MLKNGMLRFVSFALLLTLSGWLSLSAISPSPSNAAISFDAASTTSDSSAPYTLSHTVGTGEEVAIAVCVTNIAFVENYPTEVSFAGKPLSLVASVYQANTVEHTNSLWVGTAVPTGTHSVFVEYASTGGTSSNITAVSFFGVDQAAPVDVTGTATGASGNVSGSVTTLVANAWLLDCVHGGYVTTAVTPGASQTERADEVSSLGRHAVSTKGPIASPGSTTMSWTDMSGGFGWSTAIASLVPASWAGLEIFLDGSVTSSVGPGFALTTSPVSGANPLLPAVDDYIVTREAYEPLSNKSLFDATLASPTLASPEITGAVTGTSFLDEDDMASNSATKLASQQSIKAYVDNDFKQVMMLQTNAPVQAADTYLTFDLGYDVSSETDVDLPRAPRAFKVSNLYVDVQTQPTSTNQTVITLRKNGASCGSPNPLSCAVTSSGVTCSDTTNVCTVAAGDRLTWFSDEVGTVNTGRIGISVTLTE